MKTYVSEQIKAEHLLTQRFLKLLIDIISVNKTRRYCIKTLKTDNAAIYFYIEFKIYNKIRKSRYRINYGFDPRAACDMLDIYIERE